MEPNTFNLEEFGGIRNLEEYFKILVIGDSCVGKTSFCSVYAFQKFPSCYEPTIFENHKMNIVLPDESVVKVDIWDTAGQAGYKDIRK